MKLRTKTLIFGSIAVLILAVIFSLSSRLILLGSFTNLENESIRRDVARAIEALDSEKRNLQSSTTDYSIWDDIYAFVNGEKPGFTEENFSDTSTKNLRINLAFIRNCAGEMLFQKRDLPMGSSYDSLPANMIQALDQSRLAACNEDPNVALSGVMVVDDIPMLVSVHSIFKSDSSGPTNGTFVLARMINQDEIQLLSTTSQLTLSISNVTTEKLFPGEEIQIRPMNELNISGFGLVKGLTGEPVMALRVDRSRDIFQGGQTALQYFQWSMLGAGLLFLLITVLPLEKLLISRLLTLNQNVQKIGSENGHHIKLDESGKDEISSLAIAINKMVEGIETSEIKQRKEERNNIIRAIPDLLLIMTRDGVISEISSKQGSFLSIPDKKISGKKLCDIGFSEETHRLLTVAIEKALASDETQIFEMDLSLQETHLFDFRLVGLGKDEVLPILRDITLRKQEELGLSQNQERLILVADELEQRNGEITHLTEMGDLFQACQTHEETYAIVANYATLLFKGESGTLSIFNHSRNLLNVVASWGQSESTALSFEPKSCWALRRGKMHIHEGDSGVHCAHFLLQTPAIASMCMPLIAQSDILGVISLVSEPASDKRVENASRFSESKLRLVTAFAEHIGIAIANMNLREMLRNQAIRDPLTNLYNRRFMVESLERELDRSKRKESILGIIMLDIDHFKKFNDSFGHEAGDNILKTLGKYFLSHMRAGDIACRFGGEEFIFIFPETSLSNIYKRADELREGVKKMAVRYKGKALDNITVSMGISLFPEHGETADLLLQTADKALYSAKAGGRDRVIVADTIVDVILSNELQVELTPDSADL
ncbi:MAG: diguanylate cyclase [Chloroflexota bacterium]